jgi:hypothetical protein
VTVRTITAVRPSGFRIIARLQSDGDYAYIIQNVNGAVIAKVDRADHHNVPYGPDHLHRSPIENNKDVVPSFTYGLPSLDLQIIRRVLEQHGG